MRMNAENKIVHRKSSNRKSPVKVGVYGGSFNPVHYGHVGLAKWVMEHTDLDELWLMVSPLNPLKASGSANGLTSGSANDLTANFEQRLAAVREAVRDIPGVKVSDFEFSLPRPSYTANTLRALQLAYPEYDFTLVIGEDNLAIFDKWREYEYILANFRIFVYPRKGAILNSQSPILHSKNVVFLEGAPLFNISSTELRARQAKR